MVHFIVRAFEIITIVGTVSSCAFYFLCLWGAAVFLGERKAEKRNIPATPDLPPISILKPLKGIDPEIYESFRSHCLQNYPEYEIIFGVSDAADPAVASVERLQREFPERTIRLAICPTKLGANVKVSNLAQMLPLARYQYLLVNDSDIRVEPDYLRGIVAPLANAQVGMVTCLYRGAAADTLGSKLEALGISTDFCAGVLVARQLEGGLHFGLGSTLLFRRSDLGRIGGFESFIDYLADDYELGKRIAGLGMKIEVSSVVVETHLPAYRLGDFVAHQLRWARGVRGARSGGYFGLVFTFGLLWSCLGVLTAPARAWAWMLLALTLTLRFLVALVIGEKVLQDRQLPKLLWLLPLRDWIAVLVWIVSFAGRTVTWRGDRFELKEGKLIGLDT